MLIYQRLILLTLATALSVGAMSNEQEANALGSAIPMIISAKPNRCVALRQGQMCYQKITFKWATPKTGEYCLHRESFDTPLICWHGTELLKYRYAFSGRESEYFYIRQKVTNTPIAKTLIRVAWVYKSKNRAPTGWRLF